METALSVLTEFGFVAHVAYVARANKPDSGECCTQFVNEALCDRGKNRLYIETGCHLDRNSIQDAGIARRFVCGIRARHRLTRMEDFRILALFPINVQLT